MSKNLELWDALAKTDPNHTKGFNRAGGFKGTAIKPIYIIRKLTERFGACGIGWGIGKPEFQVVPADTETLVYCTVSCWHGSPENTLYGVGGDKVVQKRQSGQFCDDEAFKKAFTDAVNNAFKFVGVGADIHMGQFDDDKYVTALKAEFAEDAIERASDADQAEILTLATTAGVALGTICERAGVTDLRQLPADAVPAIKRKLNLTIDQNIAKKESA